ncbi:MAG: response regulator [Desulfobacterales bacterium]
MATNGPPVHQQAGPTAGGRPDLAAGTPLSVLVVDNNAAVLEVVAMMFKALGCGVSSAHGCQAAIDNLSDGRFDLVVSEFSLSRTNGCQLAALVKAYFPRTSVLIMTGLCQAEVAEEMSSPRVDGWIFKPFGFEELLDVLESVKIVGDLSRPFGVGSHRERRRERFGPSETHGHL